MGNAEEQKHGEIELSHGEVKIALSSSKECFALEEKPVDKEETFVKKSNILESIFNLVNSIVGGGIIGLAYSLRSAGLPMGIILLIFCGLVTDYIIILVIKCANLSKAFTYQGVAEKAFGRPGLIALSIAQFGFPFTVMMAFGVAVSDNITMVFERTIGTDTILSNRRFINALATLLFLLPLSLPRNIAILDKMSAFSIVCVLFYSIVIIIRAGTLAPLMTPTANAWTFSNDLGLAQAVGVMAFAYACLHNVFPMYRAMKDPSVKRYSVVVHASVVTSTGFYLLVALSGYVTFTGFTQGNLLNNYCPHDDLANAARFVFAFTIIFTYPFQCFTAREVLEVAFFRNKAPSLARHIIITLVLIGISLAVSMATSCLGLVIEVAGCFTAGPLGLTDKRAYQPTHYPKKNLWTEWDFSLDSEFVVFIFPPLCYMKLSGNGFLGAKNIIYWFLILFGAVVMIMGTAMAFINHTGSCDLTPVQRYWCPQPTLRNTTMSVNGTITP